MSEGSREAEAISEHDLFNDYSLLIDFVIDWKKKLFNEMPFFSFLFKKYKVKTVLDVDCGSGQYLMAMLPTLHYALGIDTNAYMIKKANDAHLVGTNFKFLNISIEHLDEAIRKERLYKKYDAALSLHNGFATIINDFNIEKRLRGIREHLDANGIFIISGFNYNKLLKDQDYIFRKIAFSYLDNQYYIIRNMKILEDDLIKYTADLYDDKGHVVTNFEQLQRPLTKKRLETLLEECGFEILDVYGNYNFEEFNVDTSKKLIVVARVKKEEKQKTLD